MAEPHDNPTESQAYANRLVDLANVEQRERSERGPLITWVTRQRSAQIGVMVAAPILMVLLLVNYGGPWLASLVETKPPAPVAREQAQKALQALVGEIESFRKDYDELPETLVEIGVPSRGEWSYSRVGERQYRVQGSLYGQSVTFESTTNGGAK